MYVEKKSSAGGVNLYLKGETKTFCHIDKYSQVSKLGYRCSVLPFGSPYVYEAKFKTDVTIKHIQALAEYMANQPKEDYIDIEYVAKGLVNFYLYDKAGNKALLCELVCSKNKCDYQLHNLVFKQVLKDVFKELIASVKKNWNGTGHYMVYDSYAGAIKRYALTERK